MNDNYWMVPVGFLALFMAIGLLMAGAKMESDRIYDNCLRNNNTMVYSDVDKMCRGIVK